MARRRKNKKRVDPFTFVKTWQESNSVQEVAKKTGMSKSAATQRAYKYRTERNIPLKKFERKNSGPHVDWDGLAVYAEAFNKE